jgi:hypothetical protein
MPLPEPIREVLTVCAAIVYGPNMEETDDVVNRNAVFAVTPDGRSSRCRASGNEQASNWSCCASGAQPSTMVSLSRESPAAPAHRRDLCASRSQRGLGD